MSDKYYVTRDGKPVAGPMKHNDAFRWLLDHQSASVDHATKHEGWKIEGSNDDS